MVGVVWCGVVGVVWWVWCGGVGVGVVWCDVVCMGLVWCGVVWCGVVWCGVVWCIKSKTKLPMYRVNSNCSLPPGNIARTSVSLLKPL